MFSGLSARMRQPLARLPIRLRLATSVAVVAFVILVAFAVVIGRLNAHRLHKDFDTQVASNAQLVGSRRLSLFPARFGHPATITPPVASLVGNVGAVVRIFTLAGDLFVSSAPRVNLGSPLNAPTQRDYNGYRVITLPVSFGDGDQGYIQYAQPLSSINGEIAGLQLLLFLGALIGTALAFGAGAFVARRAMAPIAGLTAAASEIERTGDPDRRLPEPIADDEVAELSRTLSSMLASLSEARSETEATLERQRAFVADASHELRTPLTSVLANLELLVDSLRGTDRETAESALRSTQRMRRLVADLLLLARSDVGQAPERAPLDLANVVIEAASELESVSREHVVELDVRPTPVFGNRDDLLRVVTNLLENALRHTPPGSHITASTRPLEDASGELVVADDGPGIAAELRPKLFARFTRGAGDRGGSFGLGLAIVAAVAAGHGGTVDADASPHGGARFTVRLPGVPTEEGRPSPVDSTPAEPVSSTKP
jgi:two-component system OmpR family sensor kinase